jgi:hypothetical protein
MGSLAILYGWVMIFSSRRPGKNGGYPNFASDVSCVPAKGFLLKLMAARAGYRDVRLELPPHDGADSPLYS